MMYRYFKWLSDKVYDDRYTSVTYQRLFHKLYETEFTYTIQSDARRAMDGESLRDRYVQETGDILELDMPVSVFEVLIALANRCEEDIMHNDLIGDRLGQWFWEMLTNIGIADMNDSVYNETYVDIMIHKFLYREYDPDGKGCAFRTSKNIDMRCVELWYQMQYSITENIT